MKQKSQRPWKQILAKVTSKAACVKQGLVLSEIYLYAETYTQDSHVKNGCTHHSSQFHSRSFTKPGPYGVVLIMSPWNYPFLLSLDPLIDAIAAGNTVILKPSAYSPNTSKLIEK